MLMWVVIILILGCCLYITFLLQEETTQCLANPLLYGANEFVKGDLVCSCFVNNEGVNSNFLFNKTSMWENTQNNLYARGLE